MTLELSLDAIADFLGPYGVQITLTLVVALVYTAVDRFIAPRLTESADHGGFQGGSAEKALRVARFIITLMAILALAVVWGIEFTSILVFTGTTLTLLGVALFASWSLLSNVTAYFVLLLHPTFRRGTFIRIIDADNYIEGYIADLTLFNIKLISESREFIVYPNNLVLGRPAVINPRDRLNPVGKINPDELPRAQSLSQQSP